MKRAAKMVIGRNHELRQRRQRQAGICPASHGYIMPAKMSTGKIKHNPKNKQCLKKLKLHQMQSYLFGEKIPQKAFHMEKTTGSICDAIIIIWPPRAICLRGEKKLK